MQDVDFTIFVQTGTMLKEERQRIILSEVEVHNRILLTDLAEQLDVSIDTVRRDVKELDAAQKLRKVHGGAISLGFVSPTAANSNTYALEEKKESARKAGGPSWTAGPPVWSWPGRSRNACSSPVSPSASRWPCNC